MVIERAAEPAVTMISPMKNSLMPSRMPIAQTPDSGNWRSDRGCVAKKHKKHNEQQEWAQQEGANQQQKRNYFNRAFSACMEARDYTVK